VPRRSNLVVNQCGLGLRNLDTHAVLTLTDIKGTMESVPSVCMHITQEVTAQQYPPVNMTHAWTGLRSRRIRRAAGGGQRMCLSCSFEAVPCDSLVDMLFFQLPLGAENNLAVPLNPGLNSSADASHGRPS